MSAINLSRRGLLQTGAAALVASALPARMAWAQTPVVAQHIDAAKDAAVDLVLPESKK